MIRLAVATRAETFDRLASILPAYDISVGHLQVTRETIQITGSTEQETGFDIGFIHPTRSIEAAVFDEIIGIPWINDREAVQFSRNKAAVLARLDRAGIPVPTTVMISNPVDRDELEGIFEQFTPPVVVKPNSTTRGIGVTLATDLDSFLGITDYLDLLHAYPPTADKSFLVQEFIPGARDYRAMVVDGTYVGAVERRLDRSGWAHNVHRGADAVGITLSDSLRSLVERVGRAVDIPIVGVDLLVTDDRTVVTETNARPTIDRTTKYEPSFVDRLIETIGSRID